MGKPAVCVLLALLLAATARAGPKVQPVWVDQPAWPKGSADPLVVAWILHPWIPSPKDPTLLLTPIALEVTLGTTTRSIMLEPQFGDHSRPYLQSVCAADGEMNMFPLGKHEVARVTFSEGGAGGYLVRRVAADVLAVIAWERPHGVGTRTRERIVRRMHIPRSAKVTQRVLEVDAQGTRTPYDCAP